MLRSAPRYYRSIWPTCPSPLWPQWKICITINCITYSCSSGTTIIHLPHSLAQALAHTLSLRTFLPNDRPVQGSLSWPGGTHQYQPRIWTGSSNLSSSKENSVSWFCLFSADECQTSMISCYKNGIKIAKQPVAWDESRVIITLSSWHYAKKLSIVLLVLLTVCQDLARWNVPCSWLGHPTQEKQ